MTAIGALNSLRILASQAVGAAAMALDPFRSADRVRGRTAAELAAVALAAAEAEIEVAEARSRREVLGPYTAAFDDELAGPSSEITYLDEIAGHLAAQTPLLEDIRNLLNASAAPGSLPQPPAAAAEGPAPGRTDYLPSGAGHLTVAPQCLRVAARGLRQWVDGDACTATNYWRSIAASLDAVAGAREAINDITQ